MEVKPACQLGLLEMCGYVFVWHFVLASLDQIGFLTTLASSLEIITREIATFSSDQALLPPVDAALRWYVGARVWALTWLGGVDSRDIIKGDVVVDISYSRAMKVL